MDIRLIESDKIVNPVIHQLQMDLESIEKGGYDYFMMKEIYEQLGEHLEDYEHKGLALEVKWRESYGNASATFQCGLSKELLSSLFGSVSSVSKKRIRETAEEIRRVYTLILYIVVSLLLAVLPFVRVTERFLRNRSYV